MYVVKAYKNDEFDGYVSYDLRHEIDKELDPDLHSDFLYPTMKEAQLVADFSMNKMIRNGGASIRNWKFIYGVANKQERTETFYT